MSPPQVNLSEKKEPDSTNEKKVEDLGLDFSTVIVDETERRAHRHRHHHRHRGKCIAGSVFVIVLIVAAIVTITLVLRMRHHRRHHHHKHHEKFRCGTGDHEVNVDVDHENHLIHARHHESDNVHIIHAYQRGLVAYKSEKDNICFLDRLDETFEEGIVRWRSYEKKAYRDKKKLVVLSHQPIEMEVVEHICDVHIYEICRNAKSMWVREYERKDVNMRIVEV